MTTTWQRCSCSLLHCWRRIIWIWQQTLSVLSCVPIKGREGSDLTSSREAPRTQTITQPLFLSPTQQAIPLQLKMTLPCVTFHLFLNYLSQQQKEIGNVIKRHQDVSHSCNLPSFKRHLGWGSEGKMHHLHPNYSFRITFIAPGSVRTLHSIMLVCISHFGPTIWPSDLTFDNSFWMKPAQEDTCTHVHTYPQSIPQEKQLLYPLCFHLIFHPMTAGLIFYSASRCHWKGCTTLCTIIYKWLPINHQCPPLYATLAKHTLLFSTHIEIKHQPHSNTEIRTPCSQLSSRRWVTVT